MPIEATIAFRAALITEREEVPQVNISTGK